MRTHMNIKFCFGTSLRNITIGVIGCALLGGCATAEKIANIGKAPEMTKIANPMADPKYQPVSLPMPSQQISAPEKNSLWQSRRVTFFKDQRASNIGDIITVTIDISDEATMENDTSRSRSSSESAGTDSLLGLEESFL